MEFMVYHRIFLEKSDHRVILRGDHRRTISSGLVNSRARQKPSTKILPCFSPVLVYTSFEHVLFPRCVPLAPASPPVRCPLPTPSRGRAFNPSATLFPPPSSSPSHSRLAAYTPITFEPRECKSAQIDPKIFPSFVSTQLHLFQRSILHINRAPTFGAISYVPMIHTHVHTHTYIYSPKLWATIRETILEIDNPQHHFAFFFLFSSTRTN